MLGVRLPPQEDDEREPWTMPPSRRSRAPSIAGELPKAVELVLGNQIYVAKEGLPAGLRNRLLRISAFQNPEFYQAQALRLSTYGTPRIIACAEDFPHYIGLPRGCLEDVQQMLGDLKIDATIRDERCDGRPLAAQPASWCLRRRDQLPQGGQLARGGDGWHTEGEPAALDHPDGLARAWAALHNPNAGDVLVSAAAGYEFTDLAGHSHVGGGSHGSLLAGDSEVPMLVVGLDAVPTGITGVMPGVLAHFGVPQPSYTRASACAA